MKKYGMSPAFSGAVEAVASSGGMILPPVMGAIAFVMAEWLGIGYTEVVVAAIMPAILYYVVLFISVDFVARRDGLAYDSPAGENVGKIFKNGWFYLLPIGLLVYLLLFKQLLPAWSALGALPVLIGVSYLSKNPQDHLNIQRIVKAFEGSCYRWLTVGIVTASIGILMGSLELSGLGVRVSGFLVNLGEGKLFFTLLLVAGASFVLGMGLDALPAYITLAILTAPALVKLEVPPVAAHLFVIYFGLASFITPPVCLAVYTACSITGEDIWKTGLHAVKLGAAIFIVPFAFIYHPGLLLQGSFFEIAKATLTGLAGAAMIAGGLQGYFFWGKCNKTVRAFLTAGGLVLIGI
jgi:TRAP transporter 4TM/12TM fusion protein